jgi:hypothetical protein
MATKSDEIPDDVSGNPFVSLRKLLNPPRTFPVATLASAIENDGIYFLDRFGRYKKCNRTTREAQTALNLLADVYAFECDNWGDESIDKNVPHLAADPKEDHDDTHDDQHPLDEEPGPRDWFSELGWAKKVLPNFVTIRSGQIEISRRQLADERKVFASNLHVIGALLDFIEGKMLDAKDKPVQKHPAYKGDLELKAAIADQYRRCGGVSERRLDTTFAEARLSVKRPNTKG